jgi:hypothetical protein
MISVSIGTEGAGWLQRRWPSDLVEPTSCDNTEASRLDKEAGAQQAKTGIADAKPDSLPWL